jgi:hypothetical protein
MRIGGVRKPAQRHPWQLAIDNGSLTRDLCILAPDSWLLAPD